jgi:hypothetical protein
LIRARVEPGGCLTRSAKATRHQPKLPTPNLASNSKLNQAASESRTSIPSTDPPPPIAAMLSRQALARSVRAAAPTRALAAESLGRSTPSRFYAAAAAASSADGKPPVAVFGLDGTYATALVRPSHPRKQVVVALWRPIGADRSSRDLCCPAFSSFAADKFADMRYFAFRYSTRPPPSPRASSPRPRLLTPWARCSTRTPSLPPSSRRRRSPRPTSRPSLPSCRSRLARAARRSRTS